MKKFFKKPLNIVMFALMVVGFVVLIAVMAIPHGSKYTCTYTNSNDKKVVNTYVLKDDKLYQTIEIDGTKILDNDLVGEYSISGGKLSYKLGAVSVEMGTINSLKIRLKNLDENDMYTCSLNQTILIIACVMAVVGLVGTIYGASKTKKKKK